MEEVAKMIIDGAVFVSTRDVNERIEKVFPDARTIDVHSLNYHLWTRRKEVYIVERWYMNKVMNASNNVFYITVTKRNVKRLVAHLKRGLELDRLIERGTRSYPAPTRNPYSYGLESGHVSKREEANLSVTLEVVGLEEYKEKLNQLEKLVEELNGMEISIEVTKE